jgi:hypothetical protein
MKTMTNPIDGGRFTSANFELIPDKERGRGLESLGDLSKFIRRDLQVEKKAGVK